MVVKWGVQSVTTIMDGVIVLLYYITCIVFSLESLDFSQPQPHIISCVQMWSCAKVTTVVFLILPTSDRHTQIHILYINIHTKRRHQWYVVVVCPFITQHKAPTIIHSLLYQTVESITFFTVIFMWTCLDEDIKLFHLNGKKKPTHRFTANITHKNKAVSTNNSKLSKK